MMKEVKPDAVIVCPSWEWHCRVTCDVMKMGAHAFVEVPMAVSIKELWEIVDTSEQTRKHCMMMENVNYGREELMYLNMVRQGVIGDLLYGEAAYIHELRGQMKQVERGTRFLENLPLRQAQRQRIPHALASALWPST